MLRIASKFGSVYRLLGPGGCLLSFVAVTILALAATALGCYWHVRWQETEELARIARAGEPITIAELETYYALPPGVDNLTTSWLAALAPFDSSPLDEAAEKLLTERISKALILPTGDPPIEDDDARKLLVQFRASLERLHELSHRGSDARYDLEFTRGHLLPVPHCHLIRKGVRLLTFEAGVMAQEGNAEDSVEALHAAYVLARTLRREPFGLSQLFRIGCDGVIHEQIQRLIPALHLSWDQFSLLRADVRTAHYAQGLQDALIGERVLGMAAFRDPSILDDTGDEGGLNPILKTVSFGDLPVYLDCMSRLIQAARLPFSEGLGIAERVERELADRTGEGASIRHFLLSFCLDGQHRLFLAAARGDARSYCAEAALAVAQFRRETERLPLTLDDVVPRFLDKVPTDPFDGNKLRYKITPNGYCVYSVGTDGTDQSGRTDDSNEPPDLVFAVDFGSATDK